MLQFYGVAYTVGDFAVCVGRAMMRPGEELRGYMVEVEYLPVQAPRLAQAALQARPTRLPSPAEVLVERRPMLAPQLSQATLQVRIAVPEIAVVQQIKCTCVQAPQAGTRTG